MTCEDLNSPHQRLHQQTAAINKQVNKQENILQHRLHSISSQRSEVTDKHMLFNNLMDALIVFVCVYLVGPDERLHSQVILHQLLHVGLSSDQRGELGGDEAGRCRQPQRRLVGGAGRSASVGVPEKHIPRLQERKKRKMLMMP